MSQLGKITWLKLKNTVRIKMGRLPSEVLMNSEIYPSQKNYPLINNVHLEFRMEKNQK